MATALAGYATDQEYALDRGVRVGDADAPFSDPRPGMLWYGDGPV